MFKKNFKGKVLAALCTVAMVFGSIMHASAATTNCYTIGDANGAYASVHLQKMAYYWDHTGRHSYYNGDPTYAYLNSSSRLNCNIVMLLGHAAPNRIRVNTNRNLRLQTRTHDSTNNVALNRFSLSNTILMIFSGCSTAGYDVNGNLPQVAVQQGADCAVGFSNTIYFGDSEKWNERFGSRLANGYTVAQAITYADNFNDYSHPNEQRSSTYYGNGNVRITLTRSASLNSESLANQPIISQAPNISYESANIDEQIEAALKKVSPDFESSVYEKNIIDKGDVGTYYVYTEKIGEYRTNSSYTVAFQNNKATEIIDGTISGVRPTQLHRTATIAEKRAAEEINEQKIAQRGTNASITEHKGEHVYDIVSGKFLYRVLTVYEEDGVYGTESADYEIV